MIFFFEYEIFKYNLIKYKCLSCIKDYSNKIDEELKKRFKNTFKCSNNDIKKIYDNEKNNDNEKILLLRKRVYPYEYMYKWETFNETTLPEKEEFYSNLNMEDIRDTDYMQKEFVTTLKEEHLGEYHDLYLENDTLLLADIFKSFRKKIYHLDAVKFLSAPGLAIQAALKD